MGGVIYERPLAKQSWDDAMRLAALLGRLEAMIAKGRKS